MVFNMFQIVDEVLLLLSKLSIMLRGQFVGVWRWVRFLATLVILGILAEIILDPLGFVLDGGGDSKGVPREVVKRMNEALISAASAGEVNGVERLLKNEKLSSHVNVNYAGSKKGGVLFSIASVPLHRFKEGHTKCLQLLLKHPEIDPNGPGNSWPPLKAAIQNENEAVVQLLLQHPKLIPEVDVSGLGCNTVQFTQRFAKRNSDLPAIKFIVEADSAACFSDLPPTRTVTSGDSRLRALRSPSKGSGGTESRKEGKGATSSKNPNEKGKVGNTVSSSDPFGQLPAGVLPDRSELVMNPTPFDNIVMATVYYFLGITVGFPNTLVGGISFLLWIIVMTLMFVALFVAKHVAKTRDIQDNLPIAVE